jgi:hypothetical protein
LLFLFSPVAADPVEEAGAKKLRCISIDEIRPLSGLAGGQSDAAGHPRM